MTLTKEQRINMYKRMRLIRNFEQATVERFKLGEIPGFSHSSIGQEAAIVGSCMALLDSDYITGTHRSHGHPIGKGADIKTLMAELMGKETGINKGRGGSMHFADSSIGALSEVPIVGGGLPLATGAGLSAQLRGIGQVSLCFFGDGATNQGTFHESINMAAVWNLPVIYFCENNLYAITTSLTSSHGQPEIAKRAEGYGVPGYVVDGQDVEAVYEITSTAVARARSGEGPTLIEAKTYRFEEHSIGMVEIDGGYRSEGEIEKYKTTCDPLLLYKEALIARGISQTKLLTIDEEIAHKVSNAVTFAKESTFPDPAGIYDYMYSNPINYPE